MSSINSLFLERYKILDKTCGGITAYINKMKGIPARQRSRVDGWDEDLKCLIRLRHIRNQLSHDVGTLSKALCSKSDIKWLKIFTDRVVKKRDPLSLLTNPNAPAKSGSKVGCVLLVLFVIAVIIALLYFLL